VGAFYDIPSKTQKSEIRYVEMDAPNAQDGVLRVDCVEWGVACGLWTDAKAHKANQTEAQKKARRLERTWPSVFN
jgi:hypothetical protein